MKKFFLFAIVVSASVLVSCKKDKAVTPVPVPDAPSKLLTKMTKTENNITTVFNFLYDASKRLTSYKSTDNKVGIDFTYDNNGNLIKIENNEDGFKNIYTYTYSNNIPVSGTFKSWQKTGGEPDELIEDDLLNYTVVNNLVTKIHVSFTQWQDAADFDLIYGSNGNLSKITSSSTGYTASFGYGTKKPVFPIVSKFILDQAGFSLQFAAKNELLSVAFDFPGTQFDETINNQYTYDANGYVLTSGDGTASIKYEYQ